MRNRFLSILLAAVCLYSNSVTAGCDDCFFNCDEDAFKGICGKVDLAPAYVHIDVLKSGKTIHKMDMPAIKGDMYYRVWSGLVVKPTFLYAHGRHLDRLWTAGAGIGFCIPCKEYGCITPIAGCNWGELKTKEDIHALQETAEGPIEVVVPGVAEKFRTVSPYVGVEATYNFCPGFRIVGCYQYSWSRTHTTLSKELGKFKENSKGSSYSAMLEYDLTPQWSVNLGGAYNCSLSKEKHGIRGYGFKLGVAYWF